MAADMNALREVPGIGRRTAEAIRWAVSEPEDGWPPPADGSDSDGILFET